LAENVFIDQPTSSLDVCAEVETFEDENTCDTNPINMEHTNLPFKQTTKNNSTQERNVDLMDNKSEESKEDKIDSKDSIKHIQKNTTDADQDDELSKRYMCKAYGCKMVFETQNQRGNHMRTHKDRSFNCEKCEKTFSRSDHIQKHMRNHIKLESKLADEDDIDEEEKKRRQRRIYRKRMLEKEDAKNVLYPCEIGCGKVFHRKKNMKDHMLIHNEKPLQCDQCAQRFHKRNNLQRHIRLKHQIKTWPCKVENCFEVFELSIERRNHMRRHKLYQCHICAKRLDQKCRLEQHVKLHEILDSQQIKGSI